MWTRRFLSQFDFFLFLAVVILALIGALGIYNASAGDGNYSLFARHLLWVGLGVAVCLFITSIDYHFLTDHAFLLYGLTTLLLIGILVFGTEVNGSKSWFAIGQFSFQPSEITKVVLILVLARYLSEISGSYLQYRHLFTLGALTLCPMILITLQGDLGTALMYIPILFGVVMVAGLRIRVLIGILMVTLCVAPLGWFFLKDYQKERILVTLDPGRDPQGIGYQSRQSQIAIGSGGLFGKGLGQGLQSQLGFVPEIHTDFIFAILAEEIGFVGSISILMLYLLVLMRLVRIAESARDRVGILLITGVTSFIFFHVAMNVSMTLGIMPPIGIPLPLLSYGGSSTITTFAALGLALNVHQRRFVCSPTSSADSSSPRSYLQASLFKHYNS
ncbi:MAG: rod shape-determining protein RodA [Acidobacteria bacterium]|nr:rod shape-determining protein RodA [Acidobacteriota bacterium]